MVRRYRDWLAQAKRDLNAAKDSLEDENYEWSAFQAQQAAEKAVKAFLRFHHYEMEGHTLVHLFSKVQEFVALPDSFMELARELDRHYIQPRYPNAFSEGYPGEFYDRATAERCIEYAEKILQFAEVNIS